MKNVPNNENKRFYGEGEIEFMYNILIKLSVIVVVYARAASRLYEFLSSFGAYNKSKLLNKMVKTQRR